MTIRLIRVPVPKKAINETTLQNEWSMVDALYRDLNFSFCSFLNFFKYSSNFSFINLFNGSSEFWFWNHSGTFSVVVLTFLRCSSSRRVLFSCISFICSGLRLSSKLIKSLKNKKIGKILSTYNIHLKI
ncbi:hypothetical protein BpHYR1_006849 [Brachionus plicatilis]|uniref:Uncharacterized protein n=1 Tax=Brachionus plicatilis TaxID=10195 RepID=A0A3M7P992_BRAPC|nr:hypothetical protein BpHYR1_006849 [Brachionus plicatilis]